MIGKKYPKYPAVKRLVRKHIYLIDNGPHEVLVEFIKKEKDRYKYKFYRLADDEKITCPSGKASCSSLSKFKVREVLKEDLALFVSWCTHKPFGDLLVGKSHTTRVFSRTTARVLLNKVRRTMKKKKKRSRRR